MEIEESTVQRQPWVYKPQDWDDVELIEESNNSPVPTQVPQEVRVTLTGQDGNSNSATLLATDDSFQLQGPNVKILYKDIRYVTTDCAILCRDREQADRFVIMVSTRRLDPDCEIFNMYIKPDTAKEALDILNFFHFHIFHHLKRDTKSEDPTVLQQYIRPLVAAQMVVKVHWRKTKKTFDGKRIVVLDQECISLYTKHFQEQPSDVVFFWEEQHDTSAAKVSHIKSANCVFLQSPLMYLVIESQNNDDTSCEAIKRTFRETIKPIPRIAFEDPNVMLQWLSGNYVKPEEAQEVPEEVQPQEYEPSMELEQSEMDKLHKLEKELEDTHRIPADSQERMLWNNSRPALDQATLNNALPRVNEEAWRYDANSVDDLLSAIGRIEKDMFSKVDYKAALATTLAMKRLFLESKVHRIRHLVEESAMELLCKICLRGNVAQKQASAARQAAGSASGAQVLEEAMLMQEDMNEAMDDDEEDEDP